MNETVTDSKACQHCYERIVKVDGKWVSAHGFSAVFCTGEPRITHKPMPSVWGRVEEES